MPSASALASLGSDVAEDLRRDGEVAPEVELGVGDALEQADELLRRRLRLLGVGREALGHRLGREECAEHRQHRLDVGRLVRRRLAGEALPKGIDPLKRDVADRVGRCFALGRLLVTLGDATLLEEQRRHHRGLEGRRVGERGLEECLPRLAGQGDHGLRRPCGIVRLAHRVDGGGEFRGELRRGRLQACPDQGQVEARPFILILVLLVIALGDLLSRPRSVRSRRAHGRRLRCARARPTCATATGWSRKGVFA